MPENRDGQSSMDNPQYEESSGGTRSSSGGDGAKCDQVKKQIMEIAKSGDMEKLVQALQQGIKMQCITEQEAQKIAQQAQGAGGKGAPQ